MQNRYSLHHPGNTVIPPNPGRKRLAKTLDPVGGVVPFEGKVMNDTTPKVCAVKKCVWCGYAIDQYFITCPLCKNCQYCGLMDNVDPYQCFLCGNYLPLDERTELVKINTVTGDPVEYDR